MIKDILYSLFSATKMYLVTLDESVDIQQLLSDSNTRTVKLLYGECALIGD